MELITKDCILNDFQQDRIKNALSLGCLSSNIGANQSFYFNLDRVKSRPKIWVGNLTIYNSVSDYLTLRNNKPLPIIVDCEMTINW